MVQIFPSLIAANQLHLAHELKRFEAYVDGFHIDVMDDHFVPNIAFGFSTVNALAQATHKTLFVHLMIEHIERFITNLQLKPASIISFHLEQAISPDLLIKKIKHQKLRACITLNPQTPIEAVFPYLATIDYVLLMSVEPGFSGQPFIAETFDRLNTLNTHIKANKLPVTVAIDGGISPNNIVALAEKGVSLFCVGSAIFDEPDSLTALEKLKDLLTDYR